jgi:hypothetical protein
VAVFVWRRVADPIGKKKKKKNKGDPGTGKTCWAIAHSTNAFPTDYVPRVFGTYLLFPKVVVIC